MHDPPEPGAVEMELHRQSRSASNLASLGYHHPSMMMASSSSSSSPGSATMSGKKSPLGVHTSSSPAIPLVVNGGVPGGTAHHHHVSYGDVGEHEAALLQQQRGLTVSSLTRGGASFGGGGGGGSTDASLTTRAALTRGFVRPPMSERHRREAQRESRRRWGRIAGVVLLLGATSAVAVVFREPLLHTAVWIGHLPTVEGGACYTALVAAWLLALLPTSLLEILGGFVFGFWEGAVCSSLGKAIGSFVSFFVGRRHKEWVKQRFLGPSDDDNAVDDDDDDDDRGFPRGFAGARAADDDDDDRVQYPSLRSRTVNGAQNDHIWQTSRRGASSTVSYVAGLRLALRARPFATCLALRLAYVPEAVQNFTPAVLGAPFLPFAAATALGSSAYAMLWAKLGASLKDVKDVAKDGWTTEKIVFSAVGAASLVLVLLLVQWNTNRLIKRLADDARGNNDDNNNNSNNAMGTAAGIRGADLSAPPDDDDDDAGRLATTPRFNHGGGAGDTTNGGLRSSSHANNAGPGSFVPHDHPRLVGGGPPNGGTLPSFV